MSELSAEALFQATLLKSGVVKLLSQGVPERMVTFKSFQNLVRQGVKEPAAEEEAASMPLIPPSNCIYLGNRIDSSGGSKKMDIMCYYPEKISTIDYGGTNYTIPIPNVLIKYTLTNPKGELGVWTLDTRTLRYYTAISSSPFTYVENGFRCEVGSTSNLDPLCLPNMYPDGRMCTGNNSIPTRYTDNNLMQLNWLYDLIEGSPFNDDLSLVGARTGKARRRYRTSGFKIKGLDNDLTNQRFLTFLSCFETFPYDVMSHFSMDTSGPVGRVKEEYIVK